MYVLICFYPYRTFNRIFDFLHSRQSKIKPWLIILTSLMLAVWMGNVPSARASEPVEVGYRDFSYPSSTGDNEEVTAEKPESKLWWNDGFWWGSLWSNEVNANAYHIHRLDLATQDWIDTGVALDDRKATKADTLWDGQHLYVVSHIWTGKGELASTGQRGELFRYSYNSATDTYSLDTGFPVEVNQARSETLVLDKDSAGTLWVTYTQTDPADGKYKVWVNHSLEGDDTLWGIPYVLPVSGADNLKNDGDDIASVIAFNGHIGIMWSNQNTKRMYFAAHVDGQSDQTWQSVSSYTPSADDHINLKSLQSDDAGKVFAVFKTTSSSPLIALLVCTPPDPPAAGNCASASDWTAYSIYEDGTHAPTRPILLIDTENRDLYVFTRNRDGDGHSAIYYKSSTMDNIQFPTGLGTPFIKSASDTNVNDPTSTKQNLNGTTGLVVLASDSNTRRYLHNCLTLTDNTNTCLDSNPPLTAAFSQATYSVIENAGTAQITVSLSAPSDQEVTVDYATGNGTAIAGSDYSATSGTLTFTPGQTSQSFLVSIIDDVLKESAETVSLTLSNPSGAALGVPNTATLTISDDDAIPRVAFGAATYGVAEGVGNATIMVSLSASSDQTITVDYATGDNTAVAGSDYSATSGTLTFTPGQMSQSFQIPIINDSLNELDETVTLTLSNPDGVLLGDPSVATLLITDDDAPPTVAFNAAAYSVTEVAGSATISVSLSAPSDQGVTVDYTTSDGRATAGSDYSATSGSLTFAPGQTSQSFQVPIIDDELDEPDETLTLTLSNPDGATLGTPSIAILTITDNDAPPTVAFSAPVYSVAEGDGSAAVIVSLSHPSSQTISVAYASGEAPPGPPEGGAATAGDDYTPSSGILTFAPGQTSRSFQVPITDDALDEPDEALGLTLSDPVGATLGTPSVAILTITDNDAPPTVAFSAAAYSVAEGDGSTAVTVSLSYPSGKTVSVAYASGEAPPNSPEGGTASAGDDYSATSGSLTFAPGQTSQSFEVVITDDALDEPDEILGLTLSTPNGATLGVPSTATLTITDNDAPPIIAFSTAIYTVTEGNESAAITVTLSAPSGKMVTVNCTTDDPAQGGREGGTATPGSDYTAISTTLTFAPGQSSQSFPVSITDDTLEEPDETVSLTLSVPEGAVLGPLNTAILTIRDDDGPPNEDRPIRIYLPLVLH
jgi:phosphopantetheinyl transferase (holo-ACP synthase)